jgi:hypothetical protein
MVLYDPPSPRRRRTPPRWLASLWALFGAPLPSLRRHLLPIPARHSSRVCHGRVRDMQSYARETQHPHVQGLMRARKHGGCHVSQACGTVGTFLALTGRLCVIKAACDAVCGRTRWAVEAVWPAQIAYRLLPLNLIDQMLDIDLHRWPPGRGWDLGWHQCTPYSRSTTLESNMSVPPVSIQPNALRPRAALQRRRIVAASVNHADDPRPSPLYQAYALLEPEGLRR